MKYLQRDLERLQHDVVVMASSVEEAIFRAIDALRARNADLARDVVHNDQAIDEQENHVSEECQQILALHQPVAVDLRRITAILLITTDLERMADLAVDIAERAEYLAGQPPIPVPAQLKQMTEITTRMVRQSLDSFVHQDAELAREVCRQDDEVDRLNAEIIDAIVRSMKETPAFIEPGLSLFSAVRHLERIADHATNIAEDVVFVVEGLIIRHHPEAIEAR